MPALRPIKTTGLPDLRDRESVTYLSLGAGVQSTALLVLACTGRAPAADFAIFADTGAEPPWVYETVERMQDWAPIPIATVSVGNIAEEATDPARASFVSLPVYTAGGGAMRRQCTREYKITPIEQAVRRAFGLARGQAAKPRTARAMLGISIDEVGRMRPSQIPWVENIYPLVDQRISRAACYGIVEDAGLPRPKKSACIICPFHGDRYWIDLRDNHPVEWESACRTDEKIRTLNTSGDPAFIHRSGTPLRSAELRGDRQLDLFGSDCSGSCGV